MISSDKLFSIDTLNKFIAATPAMKAAHFIDKEFE
jgi:hypothetical protein